MNIEVKILRNDRSTLVGKLADAEIHFIDGELAGLKLVGFSVWERRDGNGLSVTFPARPFFFHGDKRNFALLRAIGNRSNADARIGEHRYWSMLGRVPMGRSQSKLVGAMVVVVLLSVLWGGGFQIY